MGRATDDPVGADDGPCGVDRPVLLADVDAVGAGSDREVRAVVEHEQRAGRVAQRARLRRSGEQLVVAGRLVAQLEDVDAAAQRGLEHLGQRPAARSPVADEVQARGAQAFTA